MRIRQKYGLFAILLISVLTMSLHGQNRWEGTAVVGRYGEFPPGGLYAASNTFPLNSMISVTNTQNGKSARLIVVKRIDDPGIFLLLSESAAYELDVTSGTTTNVRVAPVNLPGLTSIDPNRDLPFHPDPDVNPAASAGDPNASIIRPMTEGDTVAVTPEPVPEEESTPEEETAEEIDERDTEIAEPIAEPADPTKAEPEVSLPRTSPQPSSAESIVLAIPPVPSEVGEMPASSVETLPESPNPVRVVVELPDVEDGPVPERPLPEYRPQELGPGEVALPLLPLSDEGEPMRPSKIPEDAIVSLEPAEPRYPEPEPEPELEPEPATAPDDLVPEEEAARPDEGQITQEPVEAEAEPVEEVAATEVPPVETTQVDDERGWAQANLPLVNELSAGASYVQVAAFTNPRSAKSTVDQLGQVFPVAVLPQDETEQSLYRIFVGPLSEDEKGSALYSVRRRGFRDAFVRDQP